MGQSAALPGRRAGGRTRERLPGGWQVQGEGGVALRAIDRLPAFPKPSIDILFGWSIGAGFGDRRFGPVASVNFHSDPHCRLYFPVHRKNHPLLNLSASRWHNGRAMKSYREELWFETRTKRAYLNITSQVETAVTKSGVREGLVLYINDDEQGLLRDYDECLDLAGTISALAPGGKVWQHGFRLASGRTIAVVGP